MWETKYDPFVLGLRSLDNQSQGFNQKCQYYTKRQEKISSHYAFIIPLRGLGVLTHTYVYSVDTQSKMFSCPAPVFRQVKHY